MVRRIALSLTLLLALSGPVVAGQLEDQAAEIEDVLQLLAQGVSDEVIIKHIEARGFVYDLTADEILELRDRGISEAVIAAMLDTAIDNQPSQRDRDRVYDRDESNDVDIYLGAGYFSPWYYYPYAWSHYYDPFPVYYSLYYYPFAFSVGWGWYGSCNYWYPNYWYGYRWSDRYYWDYAYCRPGCWVPAPNYYADRWESGRGLGADRQPGTRVRSGESVNRVHQASTSARRSSEPATRVRQGTSVTGTRPGQAATRVREGQPATQVRQGQPASRVRSGQSATRVRTPSTTRGSQPAVKDNSSSTPRRQSHLSRVRERVHTRSTTPSASRPAVRRQSISAPRRSAESSAAPRSEARAPSRARSSMRAPSSGSRAPSGSSMSRPSAPSSRMGGHISAPSAPRGSSGGGGHRR